MRRRSLALVVAGLLVVAGCASDEPVAAPSPSPSPSPTAAPSPTPPPLAPVAGLRLPTTVDVGNGKVLGPDDRDAVDTEAVLGFTNAVFDWLDGHLDDLQRGGPGHLEGVLDPATAEGLDEASRGALTTALASPQAPVAAATYELVAYHDATIEFATVEVTIADREGATHQSTMVFTRGTDGTPALAIADTEVSS